MILTTILLLPVLSVFFLTLNTKRLISNNTINTKLTWEITKYGFDFTSKIVDKILRIKGLNIIIVNFFIAVWLYIMFDCDTRTYQFVQDNIETAFIRNIIYDLQFGVDGISLFFFLLTILIMPIAILSNWKSIKQNIFSFIVIILVLETLLVTVFLVLDILFFYIFFESILPPLFILIGLFGAKNKVRASFYLFLYTLLGSLFLLLSILYISSIFGISEYIALYKTYIMYATQIIIFIGIFIAFAVKTPTIFLNIWLLKAHVESPLGGSIVLAAIVLKLSLFGIIKMILPILPEATFVITSIIFGIATITILYASISTIRTIDIKELIAYSSVSHAAVYILGVFSNIIIGIQGAIVLGIAHGFVSSGLFTAGGGALYDRSGTRLISCFRGMTQILPTFSILFFILCLGNSGTPLTLNFVGEFMCLYGAFEQLPIIGAIASSSIVLSAAYTMYMYNRISFGGSYSGYFNVNFPDLSNREWLILFILVSFTVILGIYPSPILDGTLYTVSSLIYSNDIIGDTITLSILLISLKTYPYKINRNNITYIDIKKAQFSKTSTLLSSSNEDVGSSDDSSQSGELFDFDRTDQDSIKSDNLEGLIEICRQKSTNYKDPIKDASEEAKKKAEETIDSIMDNVDNLDKVEESLPMAEKYKDKLVYLVELCWSKGSDLKPEDIDSSMGDETDSNPASYESDSNEMPDYPDSPEQSQQNIDDTKQEQEEAPVEKQKEEEAADTEKPVSTQTSNKRKRQDDSDDDSNDEGGNSGSLPPATRRRLDETSSNTQDNSNTNNKDIASLNNDYLNEILNNIEYSSLENEEYYLNPKDNLSNIANTKYSWVIELYNTLTLELHHFLDSL